MDAYEAIKERRSVRRFEDRDVPENVLEKCVNAARLSPSGANLQPLKFITIRENLEEIFEHTNWAGYLNWDPSTEEMPRAYIALIKEEDRGHYLDEGIAAQSICLTAKNEGLGSCILGALAFDELEKILEIPDDYELKLLVGLGYPKKEPEVVEKSDGIEYYIEDDTFKVPKRSLEKVWIKR